MASTDPLHGVTLQALLEALVARYGWPELGRRFRIACFRDDPTVASSLKFLRRTPWARAQVEALYLEDHQRAERNRARNQRRAARRATAAAHAEAAEPAPERPAEGAPSEPDAPA